MSSPCSPLDTSETQRKYEITLDDLRCLIKIPEGLDDPDIISFIKSHQEDTIERSLKRLNEQINDIRENWKNATKVQIYIAYELCNNDSERLLLRLCDKDFMQQVNDAFEERTTGKCSKKTPQKSDYSSDSDEYESDDFDYEVAGDDNGNTTLRSEPKKRIRRKRDSIVPLDPKEPRPKEIDPSDWSHWSPAKRRSYTLGMKNPNAYFYRNVAPGEEYKMGPFTLEEKKIFLKRVEEFRNKETGVVSGEWGLFSRALPGRVGYQCSNFYRKLVEQGEIKDPNYVRGPDGVLRHCSRLKNASSARTTAGKVSRKMKIVDPGEIKSLRLVFGDADERVSVEVPKNLSRYERFALNNPIPGWSDPLTGEIMRVPAISPDYSLLDYNTWLHTIQSKPEDPFTKKPITKRQLIILNHENWPQYRDIIIDKYAELHAPEGSVY
jgi:hypothetical protein